MTWHKDATPPDVHIPYAFEYSDSTARITATGLVATDVGKFARQADDDTIWMLTDESPVSWGLVGGGGGEGVFGSERGYAASEGESSTTSTSPVEKVSLTKTGLTSGQYHIEWSAEFERISDKNSEFNARVQINDTTTIAEIYDEKAKNGWAPMAGMYEGTLSGDVDIDMDYWDSDGADGVGIRRARISIWRVV